MWCNGAVDPWPGPMGPDPRGPAPPERIGVCAQGERSMRAWDAGRRCGPDPPRARRRRAKLRCRSGPTTRGGYLPVELRHEGGERDAQGHAEGPGLDKIQPPLAPPVLAEERMRLPQPL